MKAIRMPVIGEAQEVEVDGDWKSIANAIEAEYIEVVRPHGFGPRDIEKGSPVLVVDDAGAIRGNKSINVGASLIYGGPIYGVALVLGEGMVDSGEGFDEPDLIGLEKVPSRSADGWVGYVNGLVQVLARAHGRDI
jgi:hypothetical protein